MARDTIVPRPAVKCVHLFSFKLSEQVNMSERDQAELQAALDERFSQPTEMGKLQLTFRSKVTQNAFLFDEVQVETTTSTVNDEVVEDIVGIIESETEVSVKRWTDDAVTRRESLGVDEA